MMNETKSPSKAKLKYEQILKDLRNPVKKAVRTQKLADKLSSLFRAIILIGLSFIIIFPIFQQISLAFRHPADILDKQVIWIPETWSVLNFEIAASMLEYFKSLFNSLRVSLVVMLGQVTCSVLAGYALSRLKFKGSNIIFLVLLATFIIPPQAVSVSRMLYFSNFDILGIIGLFNGGKGIVLSGSRFILYIMAFTGQGINNAIFIFLFKFLEDLNKIIQAPKVNTGFRLIKNHNFRIPSKNSSNFNAL